VKLQVVKTVRIPVHYALTKRKLHILDRLTARLSYGICLWSQLIERNQLGGTYAERDRSAKELLEQTELPAAIVQCCYDTAKWAWRSYRQLHREWIRKVAEARRTDDHRRLLKLLKREPQKPSFFSNGVQHKIPIWFDKNRASILGEGPRWSPTVMMSF
jgi:putative transposase